MGDCGVQSTVANEQLQAPYVYTLNGRMNNDGVMSKACDIAFVVVVGVGWVL